MSLTVQDDLVVSIHYTLTNDENEVLDSSEGAEPLVYLHGAGNIIAGLENALAGKAVGDALKVSVQPEDGYGEFQADLQQVVSIDMFDGIDDLDVGMMFELQDGQGQSQLVTVTHIDDGQVSLDGNHPLAGQVLHFDVKIEDIRAASEEELEHGHVHGAGGHHHH